MTLEKKIKKGIYLLFLIFPLSCSFDYGASGASDTGKPDIVMSDVEYVRVRDAEPVVRFQAEKAERWESRRTMGLEEFSFEQFENNGAEINAAGRAGNASVELDTGNIQLGNGVSIDIDSEDITIETGRLDWNDKERILSGPEGEEVRVFRPDGTAFTGHGFTASARSRTWTFSGEVSGSYTHEDDEEEGDEAEHGESASDVIDAGEEADPGLRGGVEK
jgi:LPS export ABC transporter protein LptC